MPNREQPTSPADSQFPKDEKINKCGTYECPSSTTPPTPPDSQNTPSSKKRSSTDPETPQDIQKMIPLPYRNVDVESRFSGRFYYVIK